MATNKVAPFVCVDIGFSSIKVAEFQYTKSGCRLLRNIWAQTGLKPDATGVDIVNRVSDILSAIWEKNNILTNKIACCLPGRSVFVRQMKTPAVKDDQLDKIVKYMASQQIPFSPSEVIMDYHIFPRKEGEQGEVDVTLIAVRNEVVNQNVEMAARAGLRSDVIDVSTLALFNVFSHLEKAEGEVCAFVDIGASTTDIIIEQDGMLKFTRSAPIAGNNLTLAIERNLGITFDQAERVKKELGLVRSAMVDLPTEESKNTTGIDRTLVCEVLEDSLEAIISEVRRSIDFYMSQPDGVTVNNILLSGGSARLKGLPEAFEERLGYPVQIVDYSNLLGVDLSEIPKNQYANISPVCLGLAFRNVFPQAVRLNFIPEKIQDEIKLEIRKTPLLAQACLVGVFALLLTFYAWVMTGNLSDELDFIEKQYGDVKTLMPEFKKLVDKQEALQLNLKVLQSVASTRKLLLEALVELTSLSPRGQIWLQDLSIGVDKVTLHLNDKTSEDTGITEFMRAVNLSPYFSGVKILSVDNSNPNYRSYNVEISGVKSPKVGEANLIHQLEREKDVLKTVKANVLPGQGDKVKLQITLSEEQDSFKREKMFVAIANVVNRADLDVQNVNIIMNDREGNLWGRWQIAGKDINDFIEGRINDEQYKKKVKETKKPKDN